MASTIHAFTAYAASLERKPGHEQTHVRMESYVPVPGPCDVTELAGAGPVFRAKFHDLVINAAFVWNS